MNWKNLKKQISNIGLDFSDESKFIIGLDIGNSTSAISYWNMNLKEPQLIDISGGYGNPAMPTVVQYIPENKEWVFGEYALLNKGYFEDYTFTNIVDKLGSQEVFDIDGKKVTVPQLLSIYIKALIENCTNINPNAEVSGIVVSIPTYMDETAKYEFQRAITLAGFDKEFIKFITDRECAINYYYYKEEIKTKEKIIILDYGSRELRGGVYEIQPKKNELDVTAISSIINEKLGSKHIDNRIKDLFINYYLHETQTSLSDISSNIMAQLETFSYQNRHSLFQNNDRNIKLYFNFAYPAFQKTISPKDTLDFIIPLKREFEKFLNDICVKVVNNEVRASDITKVICLGGGFEMKWTKDVVENIFPHSKIITMKSSKGIISQGACISAVTEVGLLNSNIIVIKDFNVINYDIGVKAISDSKEQFITLVNKGDFWWQKHTEKIFILDFSEKENPSIKIYLRSSSGDENSLIILDLSELPKRPRRTTRLKISIDFKQYNTLNIKVKDLGFGDFFKATDFEKNTQVEIV